VGDTAVWCWSPDDNIPEALDCKKFNKECHQGYCVDPGGDSCQEDACAGSTVQLCWEGRTSSWDCREVDPDFVCFDHNGTLRCVMPLDQSECGVFGEDWCEGDLAKVCLWGKIVSVDCSSFQNATCTTVSGAAVCAAP
jgi:hypothetical protein